MTAGQTGLDPLGSGRWHLVGVAGAGMSGLAQVLLAEGCRVTGSDRYLDRGQELPVLSKLSRAGVRLFPQDGSGVEAGAGVVVSSAIEDDNVDLARGRELGLPLCHRAEVLAALACRGECVAVTGTSGKSTVTAMVGWILARSGRDPTVVNGAPVLNWVSADAIGNVRIGRSGLWVVEADESDRSLLAFTPTWAVITNISRDHFSYGESVELFRRFRGRVRQGAVGALEGDSAGAEAAVELGSDGSHFPYRGTQVWVPLPGRHNAENARQAVALCERLGVGAPDSARALADFRGVARRLEKVGCARGVTVIDDFAHNPAKIRAAVGAVAPGHARVLTLWRPHGFAPLAHMLEELVTAVAEVCPPPHRFYVLPVYYAGGTATRGVTSDALVERLQARGVAAALVATVEQALETLCREAAAGDAVLVMGARDPELPRLSRRILGRVAE